MKRVERTSKAKLDIAGVIRFFAEADAVRAAERFLAAIQKTYDLLASFPEIGSVLESTQTRSIPIRQFRVYRHDDWLVLYQDRSESILILRILHASQDIESALNPRSNS